MTTIEPIWHEVADKLTERQQQNLARLQDRLSRSGVSNADHLVLMTARVLAGMEP